MKEGERETQSQVEERLNEIEMERLVYSQCVCMCGEYRSLIGGKCVFLVEGRQRTYADAESFRGKLGLKQEGNKKLETLQRRWRDMHEPLNFGTKKKTTLQGYYFTSLYLCTYKFLRKSNTLDVKLLLASINSISFCELTELQHPMAFRLQKQQHERCVRIVDVQALLRCLTTSL